MLVFLLILFLTPLSAKADYPPVVITEIAASLPGYYEWIEIMNTGSAAIDISGWRFVEGITAKNKDGIHHKLNAYQGGLVIKPQEFAIIANSADNFKKEHLEFSGTIIDSSWSSLKEEGELIKIIDSQKMTVEEFTYIKADAGFLERIDSYKLDYSPANWIITSKGSPGEQYKKINNSLSTEQSENNQSNDQIITSPGEDKIVYVSEKEGDYNARLKIADDTYIKNIDFTPTGAEMHIPDNSKKSRTIFKYILATTAAIVIILVGLKLKEWRMSRGN